MAKDEIKSELNYYPLETSTSKKEEYETNYSPTSLPTNFNDIEGTTKPEDNATKNEIFAQNTAPTGDYKEGDLWFDTGNDNEIYRANANLDWVSVRDTGIGGVATFRQAGIPTALNAGDLWTDTDDNKTYRATAAGDDQITAGEWEEIATLGATFGVDIAGGGTANTQTDNDGYTTLFRQDKFGDGDDGDLTISSNTSLTADAFLNNLTINDGYYLNTNGFRLFIKGTLNCVGAGKIISNGGNGSNGANGGLGSGGTGGTGGAIAYSTGTLPLPLAGASGGNGGQDTFGSNGSAGVEQAKAITEQNSLVGGRGGNGDDYNGGNGGAAANATGTIYSSIRNLLIAYNLFEYNGATLGRFTISPSSGGGGGGGGDSTFSGRGGGGGGAGASGGCVWISAKIINVLNVEAKGGNGGNGGNGYDANYGVGGGGSGGNGGAIILIYEEKTTINSDVNGGTKGTKGASGKTTLAEDGSDGNDGVVIELNV